MTIYELTEVPIYAWLSAELQTRFASINERIQTLRTERQLQRAAIAEIRRDPFGPAVPVDDLRRSALELLRWERDIILELQELYPQTEAEHLAALQIAMNARLEVEATIKRKLEKMGYGRDIRLPIFPLQIQRHPEAIAARANEQSLRDGSLSPLRVQWSMRLEAVLTEARRIAERATSGMG